jgi:hypothetical protein
MALDASQKTGNNSGKAERHKANNLMKDELRIEPMPGRLRI